MEIARIEKGHELIEELKELNRIDDFLNDQNLKSLVHFEVAQNYMGAGYITIPKRFNKILFKEIEKIRKEIVMEIRAL